MRCTQQEIANFFGISPRAVRQRVERGELPKPSRRKYDLGECIQLNDKVLRDRINQLQNKKVAKLPGSDDMEPDTKELIEREKLAKLREEAAMREGQLAPIELLEEYADRVGSVIRKGLESLPGLIKQRIPHLRAAEVGMIENEVVRLAGRIADHDFSK